MLNVLDSQVNPLLDNSVALRNRIENINNKEINNKESKENFLPNLFVDDNTDGMRGDVEDATGLAVIELVRHALLNGTVALDVDDIAALVDLKVGRERDDTSLTERSREEVASASAVALRVGHCCGSLRLFYPLSLLKLQENQQ